jgi:hypothetical protein
MSANEVLPGDAERVVQVHAAKLTEMAEVIDQVIEHHRKYRELDETWLGETGRRLRALAAGTDDGPGRLRDY